MSASTGERAAWIDGFALDARSLAVARILFALYLVLTVNLSALTFVSELPAELWVPPPGPMRLFSGFPPRWLMLTLIAAIQIITAMVGVGWRTRASSLTLTLTLMLAFGFSFCLGKINHNMMLWLTPLFLSGQWGRAWSVDSLTKRADERPPDPLPLALFAVFIGFAMFSAGLPKLIGGWLDPRSSATYGHLFNFYQRGVQRGVLAPFALSFHSQWLWELADWLTIIWELSFLLVVRRPQLFRGYLAVAIVFHIFVMLLFNIDFSVNFVAYAALVQWVEPGVGAAGTDDDTDDTDQGVDRRRAAWLTGLGLAIGVLLVISPPPLIWLGETLGAPRLSIILTMSCAFAGVVFVGARRLRSRLAQKTH